MYERKGKECLKTIVSDETCFIKNNKTNIIPNEKNKYKYRVILQIQSVYYNMKNNDILCIDNDDIIYYPQVLVEQCSYRRFSNNVLTDPRLKFTDIEPSSESNDSDESEEEVNENTV